MVRLEGFYRWVFSLQFIWRACILWPILSIWDLVAILLVHTNQKLLVRIKISPFKNALLLALVSNKSVDAWFPCILYLFNLYGVTSGDLGHFRLLWLRCLVYAYIHFFVDKETQSLICMKMLTDWSFNPIPTFQQHLSLFDWQENLDIQEKCIVNVFGDCTTFYLDK